MAIKTSAIQGSEQSGAEETEIRTAETVARVVAVGSAAVQMGLGKMKESLQKRRERRETAPELRGNLYKGFRQAFIDNGVPKDLASEAAADLVQNKDAESSPAIAEANRIVSQGIDPAPAKKQPERTPQKQTASYQGATIGASQSIQVEDEKPEVDTAPDSEPSKKVEFEKPPSEMKWVMLQKTAKAISAETGEKPASGKKADIEPFVTDYWKAQQEEKAILSKPIIRTPIQPPKPKLAVDYSAGLAAAGADSEIAAKAGPALVDGKGADSSAAIAKANSQVAKVPERSKLQQMYYDILAKQKTLKPELMELASKDLAAGKGAHSSSHIKKAHNKILNRELDKSGLDPFQQHWSKYSRHVTQSEPKKRDYLIAAAAIRGGVSVKSTKSMLRWNSPVAAQISKQEGSTAGVNYADSVVSKAKVQAATKQMAAGKGITSAKKKAKGIEI